MNDEVVIKSRLQSLISSYVSDRDRAIADFNLILTEGYDPSVDITDQLKKIMDRIVYANMGIAETQDSWRRMTATTSEATQGQNAPQQMPEGDFENSQAV